MLAVQWVACGAVLAETHAELFLQLPEPVGVRIGGVQRLAPAGDLATLAGLGEPSTGSLTATVDFRDPESGATTQRDFTYDGRTSFATSRAVCTSISAGNVVSALAAGCGGGVLSFTVSATVDLGSFGAMTSAPRTVTLVTFSALQLRLDASPAGPTSITTLRKVQCTDTYQRARPYVTATLSTGEVARDVTTYCTYSSAAPSIVRIESRGGVLFSGAAAGTAVITATFGGGGATASKGTASATLLVEDSTVQVQSMALNTQGVLNAVGGTVFGSTLAVTLTDGTHYADLHALSWLDATDMVGYATDTPAAVTVDAAGDLTLLQNHEALVTVTAETVCSPTVSAVADTAANLAVPFRGVDLGANDGLQFSVSGDGTSLAVPVVVNAQGARLTSFQIVLTFDDAYLSPASAEEGILGGSGATSAFSGTQATLNDFPLDEVLLLGNKESAFPGGRVQLATISFNLVGSPSVVTRISGEVNGLLAPTVALTPTPTPTPTPTATPTLPQPQPQP